MSEDNVVQFRKRVKDGEMDANERYVLIAINVDGTEAYFEHSLELNGYEVIGMLEYAKNLKLTEIENGSEIQES